MVRFPCVKLYFSLGFCAHLKVNLHSAWFLDGKTSTCLIEGLMEHLT